MKKQLLMGTLAAAMMAGATAPVLAADGLSASAGVASTYLWRGTDLGSGTPAVSGDIHYSMAGAYGGLWGSSGDTANGTEMDVYAGYGMTFGGFGVDLSVWNYQYPKSGADTNGDLSEAILALSFAGATFKYYDNIAGSTSYEYYTLGYSIDKFSGLVGFSDSPTPDTDYTHLDLTYAYNSNLSFTMSKIVDQGSAGTLSEQPLFVVSYALPIN